MGDSAIALLLIMCMFSSVAAIAGVVVFKDKICSAAKVPILCGGSVGATKTGATKPTTTTATSPGGNVGVSVTNGTSGKANITFFGQDAADDNGEGMSGIDLFKYAQKGYTFNGKPLYPAAVHQYHFGAMAYKILAVECPKFRVNPVYVHVLDMCDSKDKACNVNVKANGLSYLVDIHATAKSQTGVTDGVLPGSYKVVGERRPKAIPLDVWIPGVSTGKDSILCSCAGQCEEKDQKWTEYKACTT